MSKEIICKCDRCGKKHLGKSDEDFYSFKIITCLGRRTVPFDGFYWKRTGQKIDLRDLCPECVSSFDKWFSEKNEKNDKKEGEAL